MTDVQKQKKECPIVQDLLPLYVDDVVSPETREWIQRHLQTCPDCQRSLDQLKKPDPVILQKDMVLESDLRKTGRQLRHRRFLMSLGAMVFLVLAVSAGVVWWNSTLLPADYISVAQSRTAEDGLKMQLESEPFSTGLFSLSTRFQNDSVCEIEAHGGRGLPDRVRDQSVVLPDTVREVLLNGEIIWQDGITVTPRCRQLYPYAGGYAGDVKQMQLARPGYPDSGITMEADTENPDHCAWTYVIDETRTIPETSLQEAAWLAMVLTPNLDKVTYRFDREEPLVFTRQALAETLGHKPDIESPADLQRIMNRILPAAG